MYLVFFLSIVLKRYLHFFQVLAGAMEESSVEDDDSNVQDEIKKYNNKIVWCLTAHLTLLKVMAFSLCTILRLSGRHKQTIFN